MNHWHNKVCNQDEILSALELLQARTLEENKGMQHGRNDEAISPILSFRSISFRCASFLFCLGQPS